jgi:hypothetical protein
MYAYNHEEAIACFERALALDPSYGTARENLPRAQDAMDPGTRGSP